MRPAIKTKSAKSDSASLLPFHYHMLESLDQIVDREAFTFSIQQTINGVAYSQCRNHHFGENGSTFRSGPIVNRDEKSPDTQPNDYKMPNVSSLWESGHLESVLADEDNNTLVLEFVLSLKCTKSASQTAAVYNSSEVYRDMIRSYSKMLHDPEFADYTFVVKGKEFKVHKAVLAAASPFFVRLFRSKMEESLNNICRVDSIDPEIFEMILKFIYEAKLPEDFKSVGVNLYKAAHYYELERLTKICEREIRSHLTAANALESYKLAYIYELDELKAEAWEIVNR